MSNDGSEKNSAPIEWYVCEGAEQTGPITTAELRSLANSGQISAGTLLWRTGLQDWARADRFQGLLPASVADAAPIARPAHDVSSDPAPPPAAHVPSTAAQSLTVAAIAPAAVQPTPASDAVAANTPSLGAANPRTPTTSSETVHTAVNTARRHATDTIRGLQQWDIKNELFPLHADNVSKLLSDPVFWSVILLGGIPLLIGTLEEQTHQLLAFALFFAGLWAVIFRYFIVRPAEDRWGLWIGSLLFTGVVGIFGLLLTYSFLPQAYVTLPTSENSMVRLIGSVLQTGLCEELCKAVPVIGYLAWQRANASPMTALMIGVFSGLGFAAFENVHYGELSVMSSIAQTVDRGAAGLVQGVRSAMVLAMLRSISLVFCHAVWSGIVAYFLTCAFMLNRHVIASFVIGIAIAATLHGTYNWLAGVQPTFASAVVVLSFVLFYSYVSRQRTLLEAADSDGS